ncbi:putative MFS transporter [Eremomyces bilateralis CBS 781.70]|uniref:MFS transporter n=1 Tax=Eremomyces bilateralis CBS 781.70 TaxID=1392243 RepID=A0A6G1GFJ6_9PEZI|nr:putative MFS transporter [Eremomyces bilateralis CBS 781.70]KAF1816772.1 putative MFS transporter [Eremomyces bilateralis CBS 781.70]
MATQTSTYTMELSEHPNTNQPRSEQKQHDHISLASRRHSHVSGTKISDSDGLPSPTTATEKKVFWNHPRSNIARTFATFYCFIVLGANDAALGALIPYLEKYYELSYTVVSLIFLSPVVGYTLSALLNNYIHVRFGHRGVSIVGPIAHLVAYMVASLHPPYPVLVVFYMLAGFGNGLLDAAWNAWIGNMNNANELLGFLHGFYGLGATISPLIATSMITKANLPWYNFYYVMIGLAFLELVTCLPTFWKGGTGAAFRAANAKTPGSKDNTIREALFVRPYARVVWLITVFLLVYMGVEVTLGGWIVTFMLRIRHGSDFASGMAAVGFWLGMTVGRVVLGFVTPRIGEKLSICIYLPISMALQLVFWLVPQFHVSAVAVALEGFFLGPMFPAAVIVAMKLLPRHLHVTAIGFAAALGGVGAAVFPFAVGAIAQKKGVQVLQPIALALLVVILAAWLALPRLGKKKE